ncbi:hypothetical protein R1sor_006196 [Riccia sorocarpa]|uniref:Uncharacterized protein n=1 Tax=Riccia sorocarpa TaxID=122646 RepID=A0ABD3HQK4_9MARC
MNRRASTAQEPRIIGTPQSGEEFPLANILSQPRSVEATEVASPIQASDRNDNSEPIAGVPVTADNAADEVPLAVDEGRPEDNATASAEEANAQIPGNTSGLSDENRARHSSTKASVKYARDFLLEVKSVNFA